MKKDKLEKFIFVVKKTNELEIEEIKQMGPKPNLYVEAS